MRLIKIKMHVKLATTLVQGMAGKTEHEVRTAGDPAQRASEHRRPGLVLTCLMAKTRKESNSLPSSVVCGCVCLCAPFPARGPVCLCCHPNHWQHHDRHDPAPVHVCLHWGPAVQGRHAARPGLELGVIRGACVDTPSALYLGEVLPLHG